MILNNEEQARRSDVNTRLKEHLDRAEQKAWDSLARYKFQIFGYWCAIWTHLNQIEGQHRPNPWRSMVGQARGRDYGLTLRSGH